MTASPARELLQYPPARRQPLREVLYGLPIEDPYRWLEDRESAEVGNWVKEQSDLYACTRAGWASREQFLRRLRDSAVTHYTTPQGYGGRDFWTRCEPGQEHPVLLVDDAGVVRTLVDPMRWDSSGQTVLERWQPSWDGSLVAIQLSSGGSEDSVLHVISVLNGDLIDGPIDRVRNSSVCWLPDNRHYYYVRRLPPELIPGEEQYHRRVYLHTVGRPADEDVLVFGDASIATAFYSVSIDEAGRKLVIARTVGADHRRDIWIADLSEGSLGQPRFQPLQLGVDARTTVRLSVELPSTDHICLQTDRDAPRGRVMTADLRSPRAQWAELIGEDPGAVLAGFNVLAGSDGPVALVSRRRHATDEIAVMALATHASLGYVPLPGLGVVGNISVDKMRPFEARFSYSDPAAPPTVLCYDARTGLTRTWEKARATACPIPSVRCQRVSYQSMDGTEVGMFLVSRMMTPDRPRPTILTGYGGFGVVRSPFYRADALAWVQQGGIWASACLRGGGEEGAAWHLAGRKAHKQNTFDDFDAAAVWLVRNGWTTPEQLGIFGDSNGGLLIGAALTQHPERYAAAVCLAPLLDMVRYERFGRGASWRDEYGTAAEADGLSILHSYSPYHAVRHGTSYPAVLLGIFEGDSRVDPLHARKMCAALQHASVSGRPVLLRSESGVGHGNRASSSRDELMADYLAFFAEQLG